MSSSNSCTLAAAQAANIDRLPFPSLDVVALNHFKRCIDTKDVATIEALLEANPRYLVNYSSDGPTILRQGARYNAVICATVVNAPAVLAALPKRINSLDFMRRCYPNLASTAAAGVDGGRHHSEEEREAAEQLLLERRNRFLDVFLNTPDKVLNNTPLHFACRVPHLACIKVLLNYVPTIDINLRNRSGKTPLEVVGNAALRPAVEELFARTMFVTVLRSETDLGVRVNPPIYGRKSIESVELENRHRAKISAIAGPMSPQEAERVYQTLRSPKHCTRRQVALRMVDPERGVEKVARDLSFTLHVPCKEYWPFLGEYLDITSAKGLDRLEQHLKMQAFARIFEKLSLEKLSGAHLENSSSRQEAGNAEDAGGGGDKDVAEKDADFHDAAEEADSDDDVFYSAPSSPIPEEEEEEAAENEKSPSSTTAAAEVYMTGPAKDKVDSEVLAVLEMALEQGTLTQEAITRSRPLLAGWFSKVRQSKPPPARSGGGGSSGGDDVVFDSPAKMRLFIDK